MLKRLFSLFLALFMGVWNFIAICYGVGVAWGPKIDLDKFELTFERLPYGQADAFRQCPAVNRELCAWNGSNALQRRAGCQRNSSKAIISSAKRQNFKSF